MKLVNWNVAGANPHSEQSSVVTRAAEIRNQIDRHLPEIVCLTKANLGFFKDGHEISSGPDYGCGYQENRRKVLLWSKESWERVDDTGDARMPPGRFISGVTRTSVGVVTVIGLCIPWKDSQSGARYSGERREPWEDHELYLKHLAGVLARAPSERLVVMGDFNQKISKSGRTRSCRANLLRQAILRHRKVVTSRGRSTIDHIVISADMEVAPEGVIGIIPGASARARYGVVADVLVRGS